MTATICAAVFQAGADGERVFEAMPHPGPVGVVHQ
jgi:hypothetical protein